MTSDIRGSTPVNLHSAMRQLGAQKKLGFLELIQRILAVAMVALFAATLAILILVYFGHAHPYTSFYTLGGCALLVVPIALVSCQRERVAKEGGVDLKARDRRFFSST